MIVFGCSITAPDLYARCAERGFRLVAEPDSEIIANAAAGSLFRSYNLILDTAASLEELEALVLVHQDAEIADRAFCSKLRQALKDPDVGVVGCVGAIDVRNIAWWEGSVTWASFAHRYSEFLGSQIHGYDFDFCLQVREAGRKVITADFKAIHHHSLELVRDSDVWVQAHMKVAEKWEDRMPGIGLPNWGAAAGDWKQRARLAEAEAGASRLEQRSTEMQAEARERQLQAQLDEVLNSTSWKLTAPLRRVNAALKARRDGSAP
jgi:hypothetical protein